MIFFLTSQSLWVSWLDLPSTLLVAADEVFE